MKISGPRVNRVIRSGATSDGQLAYVTVQFINNDNTIVDDISVQIPYSLSSAFALAALAAQSLAHEKRLAILEGSDKTKATQSQRMPKIDRYDLGAAFNKDGSKDVVIRLKFTGGAALDLALPEPGARQLSEQLSRMLESPEFQKGTPES